MQVEGVVQSQRIVQADLSYHLRWVALGRSDIARQADERPRAALVDSWGPFLGQYARARRVGQQQAGRAVAPPVMMSELADGPHAPEPA